MPNFLELLMTSIRTVTNNLAYILGWLKSDRGSPREYSGDTHLITMIPLLAHRLRHTIGLLLLLVSAPVFAIADVDLVMTAVSTTATSVGLGQSFTINYTEKIRARLMRLAPLRYLAIRYISIYQRMPLLPLLIHG